MVYFDKLNQGIERIFEAKQRKRLRPCSIADGPHDNHRLARFCPECREKSNV